MKEQADLIFSQYRVTGSFLGFNYPKDGFKHALCMLLISLVAQSVNTYTHSYMSDGELVTEGSNLGLRIVEIIAFVIGFWLLNVSANRFFVLKVISLVEKDVALRTNLKLNDDDKIVLLHRGCQKLQSREGTVKGFLLDMLRIFALAITMSILQTAIVLFCLTHI